MFHFTGYGSYGPIEFRPLYPDITLDGFPHSDIHGSKRACLIRMIPQNRVIVSESGIRSYEDIMFLRSLGVNAVLIGEAFMESDDIAAKMREMMHYQP